MSGALNENEWKKLIASMPEVPKYPPGYYGIKENQQQFLNKAKAQSLRPFNLAMISDRNLSEASYYAKELNNKNANHTFMTEKIRRITPPFRTPDPSRPNMPKDALTKNIGNKLIREIYLPKSPTEQAAAYHKFIDIYLADWVNRKGFVNNGEKKYYTPFADEGRTITDLEVGIEKILKESMLEKPNPRTLKKLPGNSIRQQYLKDLLERIQKRKQQLMMETFNKITKSNREKFGKSLRQGGKRTRKYKTLKKQNTRRH